MSDRPDNADLFASPEERRALSADELSLVDLARQPTLGKLSTAELADLISRLRDRRNRARDISDRQAREARSKAPPSGQSPAHGNDGSLSKHHYLDTALERAQEEQDNRKDGAPSDRDTAEGEGDDNPTQSELAAKASAIKARGDAGPNPKAEDGAALHPHDPDASDGKAEMQDTARRTAPSGALDHAGAHPARKRSMNRR